MSEVAAVLRGARLSAQKARLVADQIRGKNVAEALDILTFSGKKGADIIKKVLESAIANAEHNHGLDVDELVVAEAWVGKNLVLKRGRPRGRGRFGRLLKPFAEITIKVRQQPLAADEA